MSKYSLYYYKMQVFFRGHSYAALKGRHLPANSHCEDDSLLDTNPLKDYPPEDLDEQGYRKCFNNENEKLRCAMLHVLSEVFWLKYEVMPDYEVTSVTGWRKSFKRHKDMLFRKYLECREAYKKAKKKLKEHR